MQMTNLMHAVAYLEYSKFINIRMRLNLEMLLPSKMMGLLSSHQFDGLGMSMTSLTTPLQLSLFISEWNAYFTTSNQFTVEKQAMPSIFLIQYSVSLGSTSQYGSKNLRFTLTLRTN